MQVNITDIKATVTDYISCVIAPDPGFACPLAASIMPADYVLSQADESRSYAPKNYVGVLQWMPDIQVCVSPSFGRWGVCIATVPIPVQNRGYIPARDIPPGHQ